MIEVADLDRGVLGILNDSPGNEFAHWVTDGVTDLDRGVLGIPSDRLAIPVAYWVGIGVAHSV